MAFTQAEADRMHLIHCPGCREVPAHRATRPQSEREGVGRTRLQIPLPYMEETAEECDPGMPCSAPDGENVTICINHGYLLYRGRSWE